MAEYIGRRFKVAFIIRFLLGMVIIALFSCLLLYAIIPDETATHYFFLMSSYCELRENLLLILLTVGICEIILAIYLTLLLGLFVSHRIGGPVYKLESSIEQLRQGNLDLADISFRDQDQGKILARCFNDMVRSWHLHFSEMKFNYGKLAAQIDIMEKNVCLDDHAAQDRLITGMKHDLEKLQDVLDRFAV